MRAGVLTSSSIQHSGLYSMDTGKSTADNLLASLAQGNMSVLDQLYDQYRNDFLRWAAQRFQVKNREDIIDAWHDTMIMFYEQVRDKKLVHLTCEIKTYLFTIGYRRLLKMYKKSEKIDLTGEFDANINIDESINVLENEAMTEQQHQMLEEAVKALPEKSRRILIMRYMEGKSIPQIMKEMNYESENAVSVTLSRGLRKLKEFITERKTT